MLNGFCGTYLLQRRGILVSTDPSVRAEHAGNPGAANEAILVADSKIGEFVLETQSLSAR